MKMKMIMKNRSFNRPGGKTWTRIYKNIACLGTIMPVCNKQYLSETSGSIY